MTEIRITREFPHPRAKVWRALTDPECMAKWGMRPEGFAAVVGTRCKFVGEANRHWRGYVECEVLEVRAPSFLRYSWVGDDNGDPTIVTYELEDRGSRTHLVFSHSGFKGIGGFFLAKLIMGPGWKKMLAGKFVDVLNEGESS